MSIGLPLLKLKNLTQTLALSGLRQMKTPSPGTDLPGPTDTEVLAADERLRRMLANQRGRRSTVVTGGLAGTKPQQLSMPSLLGVS